MKALVIAGSTGAGKTAVSLELCSRIFPSTFEIISADSVQVYRGLDVGSGKLPVSGRCGIAHHLIDVVDPDFHFDVSEFCNRAALAVSEIQSRGKIPCFVGGTGLYLEGFFDGLSPVPEIDPAVREAIMRERAEKGDAVLRAELEAADPESAARIHPNDWQRTLRALQVWRGTGHTMSWYRGRRVGRGTADTLYVGIDRDREELDRAIEKRVDGMMADGFLDEVRSLLGRGYSSGLNSMRSIGYHQLSDHIEGRCPLNEAVDAIKRETRDYSRKQYTWFRRNSGMEWFDVSDAARLADAVGSWLGGR